MPYKDPQREREYRREYMRRRRACKPEKERERAREIKRKYGLSVAEWDVIFTAQGRVCAICKTGEPGSRFGWHTDHCHTSQKVRGVLCWQCNVGIGNLKDSPVFLREAAEYLEKHANREGA